MELAPALTGLTCRGCDAVHDPTAAVGRCPDCGGHLDTAYDLDAAKTASPSTPRAGRSMWDFGVPLPFSAADAVTLGEGGTPLVDCDRLADELDVGRLLIKDEGRNPTGSVVDRGLSVAVSAATAAGASDVALAATGDDGHAAAAYAARAGLDAHVFVPSRAGFVQKAMINVFGADMTVVEGRLRAAEDARRAAMDDDLGWRSVAPFETPYYHDALKTALHEVVASLDEAPDAVVYPTGHGAGLVGARTAAEELRTLGLIESVPRLYAAQASGCAPIARALESGSSVRSWDHPDTICADIEVPEPAAGAWAVDAVTATGGDGVSTGDDEILTSAVTVAANEGVAMSPSGAAAASGAWALADRGAFDPDDTVVLVNTGDGAKTADVLRSHLMGRGV